MAFFYGMACFAKGSTVVGIFSIGPVLFIAKDMIAMQFNVRNIFKTDLTGVIIPFQNELP